MHICGCLYRPRTTGLRTMCLIRVIVNVAGSSAIRALVRWLRLQLFMRRTIAVVAFVSGLVLVLLAILNDGSIVDLLQLDDFNLPLLRRSELAPRGLGSVLFQTLHEVDIIGEVDAADRLDSEVDDNESGELHEDDDPPGECGTEVVDEGVADDVNANGWLVHLGENAHPDEPSSDAESKAAKDDERLGVCFQNAVVSQLALVTNIPSPVGTYNSLMLIKTTATVKQTQPMAYKLLSDVKSVSW